MKKVSENDQQLHTADQPTTPQGRATKHLKLYNIYGEVCALHRSY